jgi:hypothetical protein
MARADLIKINEDERRPLSRAARASAAAEAVVQGLLEAGLNPNDPKDLDATADAVARRSSKGAAASGDSNVDDDPSLDEDLDLEDEPQMGTCPQCGAKGLPSDFDFDNADVTDPGGDETDDDTDDQGGGSSTPASEASHLHRFDEVGRSYLREIRNSQCPTPTVCAKKIRESNLRRGLIKL